MLKSDENEILVLDTDDGGKVTLAIHLDNVLHHQRPAHSTRTSVVIASGHQCIADLPRPAKSHSTLSKPKLCKVREMVDLLEKTMAYRGTDGQNVYRMFNWNSKVICHVAAHVYDIS